MNNKHHKENNQLSLVLELPQQPFRGACSVLPSVQQRPASIIAFPVSQFQGLSFRERVIQDLVRNHIMVK